jgi:acyl-CoA synthetase (AMP-forming)/AMP-acid ligase II
MLELNRKGFIDLTPMADYTLPIVALLNAAKFKKMYQMMFGETRIEDLWLKYYCVSSNLTRGEAVIAFLKSKDIATYKLPEKLVIVERLPRNPAGKVLKSELREQTRAAAVSGPLTSAAPVGR